MFAMSHDFLHRSIHLPVHELVRHLLIAKIHQNFQLSRLLQLGRALDFFKMIHHLIDNYWSLKSRYRCYFCSLVSFDHQ